MRLARLALLSVLLAAPAAAQIGAAPAAGDARVRTALEAAGLTYEVDSDGDFRVLFAGESGRSQLVLINSNTETLGTLEIREVYSIAHRFEGDDLPADLATRLLRDSYASKLGAWMVNGSFVASVVRVDAGAGADVLQTALQVVNAAADELERELTGDTDAY